ncbi:MAG: selenocysteine-specific translation elongation factor [Myxococcota bacterium]
MARAPEGSAGTEPPRLVLGTAGHIDHGKTALIRALTGVDTDRLPEEKARGITIELGFAPLDLPGGPRLGVVDVPGHEGLVRTMVAGATGIDLVLLVVAADEGVMPQTREHVAICDLLGIERGVVALSKVDCAPPDVRELAAEEVRELLAPTRLAGARVVPVSSATGEGCDVLRETLAELACAASARTPREGPPRLPVDRLFGARGFGAVVTGTLVGAALRVGNTVVVEPAGIQARVRGLQQHGRAGDRVAPGARCAVNLQGVELRSLSRGQVVTLPGALAPTRTLDVEVSWLEDAPPLDRDGTAIEFLTGTAERVGRLAPIGATRLEGGGTGFARVHLSGEPLPALPGDRFVARGFTRRERFGMTLGGGRILDVAPPHRRRSDPGLLAELERLRGGDPVEAVAVRVVRTGYRGATASDLRRETGLPEPTLARLLEEQVRAGRATRVGERWIAAEAVAQLEQRLLEALDAFHESRPLRPGAPRAALGGALPENAPRAALDVLLLRLATRGELEALADWVRRPGHRPRLSPEEEKRVEQIRAEATGAGLEPPTLREWSDRLGVEPEAARRLLVHLERQRELVRAPGELWFGREAVERLRTRVVECLRERGSLDTPAYKKLIGTTRKHAVPLMELFDAERTTLRQGDVRVLRGGGSG